MNIGMNERALKELEEIPNKVNEIDLKIDKAFDLNISNELIENRINKLNKEKNDLKDEELRLKKLYSFYMEKDKFIERIEKLVHPLNHLKISNKKKETIVRSLIENITVSHFEDQNKHMIFINFKIDPSSNLKIGTELRIDSIKYDMLDNIVRLSHIDDNTIPNLDFDLKESKQRRWVY